MRLWLIDMCYSSMITALGGQRYLHLCAATAIRADVILTGRRLSCDTWQSCEVASESSKVTKRLYPSNTIEEGMYSQAKGQTETTCQRMSHINFQGIYTNSRKSETSPSCGPTILPGSPLYPCYQTQMLIASNDLFFPSILIHRADTAYKK